MPGFENQQSYVQENHRAKGNGDSDLKELAHRLILRRTQCKSSSLTRTKAIHEGDPFTNLKGSARGTKAC